MKKYLPVVSLTLLPLMFLLLTCAKPKDNGTGPIDKIYTSKIAGKVVNKTGAGIAGVTVTTKPDGHTTTTFPDGSFELPELTAGVSYTLYFSTFNYNDTVVGAPLLGLDDSVPLPTPVKLVSRYSTLAGSVYLDAARTILAGQGVGVEIEKQNVSKLLVTPSFYLSGVQASTDGAPVRLIAAKQDVGFGYSDIVLPPDTAIANLAVSLDKNGGTVTGTVVENTAVPGGIAKNATQTRPVSGVEVTAVGGALHDVTDSLGVYVLRNVPSEGSVVFYFTLNGKVISTINGVTAVENGLTSMPRLTIGNAQPPQYGFTLTASSITLALNGATVTPRVNVVPVNPNDTIRFARFYWNYDGIPGWDDSTKTSWLDIPVAAFNWQPGETSRQVYCRVRLQDGTFSDSVGTTVVRTIPVQDAPSIVSGVVADKAGAPLSGVTVTLSRASLSDTTMADGRFVIATGALQNTVDTLVFFKNGFLTAGIPIGSYDTILSAITMDTIPLPVIGTHPAGISISDSSSAVFFVVASGTGLVYQWQKNDADISGATDSAYTTPIMRMADSGTTFRCIVSNEKGADTTARAMLNVTPRPPRITVGPKTLTARERDTVRFSVAVSGTPPFLYQWYMTNQNMVTSAIKTATDTEYQFAAAYADSGTRFYCIITNAAGKDTSSAAILYVNLAPPLITLDPRDTSVFSGDMATFSVSAVSPAAMTYQWQQTDTNKVTSNILRATKESYSIAPTMVLNRMRYRCIVTNAAGSDTSLPATLTVTPAGTRQMKLIPAANKTLTVGGLSHQSMAGGPILDTVHQVTFTKDFLLDSTEVTQKDFLALMGVNPAKYAGSTSNPVDQVSWFDAALYCNARSKRDGLDTVYRYSTVTGTPGNGASDLTKLEIFSSANGYRLPTEAEWEYACHGGTTTLYWWGADTNGAGARIWSALNSANSTRPVASTIANGYKLFDMSGNVNEWCNDWLGVYTGAPLTNPAGPASGTARIVRGGSIIDRTFDPNFRPQYRASAAPGTVSVIIGFRCVLLK